MKNNRPINFVSVEELEKKWAEFSEELFTKLHGYKPQSQNEWISRNQAAKILGISLPTLWKRTLKGEIIGYKNGGRVRYKLSDVEGALLPINV